MFRHIARHMIGHEAAALAGRALAVTLLGKELSESGMGEAASLVLTFAVLLTFSVVVHLVTHRS